MTDLEKMAIKSAYPFGGWVRDDYKEVTDGLEKSGVIEYSCKDSEGYGYVLTKKGRNILAELD